MAACLRSAIRGEFVARCVGAAAWVGLAAGAVPALGQIDTGPTQQTTGFWAPYGNTVNSVVAIRTPAAGGGTFTGTGTIIDKRPDGNPQFGWLCVLTANHVLDAKDPNIIAAGGFGGAEIIHVASDFTNPVESFGGATNVRYFGQRPVNQGGLNKVDIAVLAVRVPANSPAYTLLTPVPMTAVTAAELVNDHLAFSEIGFGGSGTFGMGGGPPAVGGIFSSGNVDGIKRFQNNTIHDTLNINDGFYLFQAVQWIMDKGAAPANPTPFLVAEGISYGGDSGGPYMGDSTSTLFTQVNAFQRDNAADPANWPGGLMPFYSRGIVVVHTNGNSRLTPAMTFDAYGTTIGAGVPLTQARINWVAAQCARVPNLPAGARCYANCDNSVVPPCLNVLDFACFLNAYSTGDPYANCDESTFPPVLNVLDFACFLNQFALGCTDC